VWEPAFQNYVVPEFATLELAARYITENADPEWDWIYSIQGDPAENEGGASGLRYEEVGLWY
jgi:hypothetical protein